MGDVAQNNDIQIILDQMRLIQGDLEDLQLEVYGGIPARPAGDLRGAPAVAAFQQHLAQTSAALSPLSIRLADAGPASPRR